MALGAVLVDAGVVGAHLPVIGYANYLLVWGSMYQWGFAWRDGTLTHPRWRPYAFAAVGAAAVAGLVAWGPFPVDMIGAGERVGNTTPPSIALLAYAAAEIGLVLAAAAAVSRVLVPPPLVAAGRPANPAVMLVYMWHMVPVVIAAVAFYPAGVMPQPRIGSAEWWELRPVWEALLAVILITLIAGLLRLHRPLLLVLPTGLGPGLPWSPAVVPTLRPATITPQAPAVMPTPPDAERPIRARSPCRVTPGHPTRPAVVASQVWSSIVALLPAGLAVSAVGLQPWLRCSPRSPGGAGASLCSSWPGSPALRSCC